MGRILLWRGTDDWRTEVCDLSLAADHLDASGTQVGRAPHAYRADYSLTTSAGWLTRELRVAVTGDGWWRELHLEADGTGGWTCRTSARGDVDLPPPGAGPDVFDGTLDCDLGLSPLTNLMPVRRPALHERAGSLDLDVALVSVPDLAVHRSTQRYEHVATNGPGTAVRFSSGSFTAVLDLDADGVVVRYPGLAERVPPATG